MRKLTLCLLTLLSVCIFACSDYGDKLNINDKSEVYYKDGGTKEDAKRLGDFLLGVRYFDNEVKKSVQLTKPKDTFMVKFVIDEAKLNQVANAETGFRFMKMMIRDSVFGGKPTSVILANEKFEKIKEIGELTDQDIMELQGNQ